MKNLKYLVFIILVFSGCSVKKPIIGKKAFDKEDNYIIKALVEEYSGEFNKAFEIYNFLYKKTKKRLYLDRAVEDLYSNKDYKKIVEYVDNLCKKNLCDDKLLEYKVLALINLNRLDDAKKILLKKLNKKNRFFYSMMSYIYIKENKLELALVYLKSLYALNPSKENLLKMVDVMIQLQKYNEALAYLRTHLGLYGCERDICLRLINIYKSLYDYDNLAIIYEKMAKYDKRYLILALNLYIENGEFFKAEYLIKKYNLNTEYLMYLYEKMKRYKKAAMVALDLYNKTGNLKYLLKYCENLYFSNPSKKEVKDIVKKLKYISTIIKSPYIYNFLGYIEIKYDINIKEGIKYIQKALILDPTNEEYMDSLAWGYYKLGKCEDAYEIIKNVHLKDKEIEYHKKKILECKEKYDTTKNNKQNKRGIRKKEKRD